MKSIFVLLVLLGFSQVILGRNNCEVITLSYGDGQYAEGLIALGQSLNVHSPTLQKRVLMASESGAIRSQSISFFSHDKFIASLETQGWHRSYTRAVQNPFMSIGASRLKFVYTKLNIWEQPNADQTTYIYMDSDVIVKEDISWLCDLPEQIELAGVLRDTYMNGGVMVIRPTPENSMRVRVLLETIEHSYNGGDQGFFNQLYPAFISCPYLDENTYKTEKIGNANCARLPPYYNADIGLYILRGGTWWLDPYFTRHQWPAIVHYTLGVAKPWNYFSYLLDHEAYWNWYSYYQEALYENEVFRNRALIGWYFTIIMRLLWGGAAYLIMNLVARVSKARSVQKIFATDFVAYTLTHLLFLFVSIYQTLFFRVLFVSPISELFFIIMSYSWYCYLFNKIVLQVEDSTMRGLRTLGFSTFTVYQLFAPQTHLLASAHFVKFTLSPIISLCIMYFNFYLGKRAWRFQHRGFF